MIPIQVEGIDNGPPYKVNMKVYPKPQMSIEKRSNAEIEDETSAMAKRASEELGLGLRPSTPTDWPQIFGYLESRSKVEELAKIIRGDFKIFGGRVCGPVIQMVPIVHPHGVGTQVRDIYSGPYESVPDEDYRALQSERVKAVLSDSITRLI